jgi:hypothetical protein
MKIDKLVKISNELDSIANDVRQTSPMLADRIDFMILAIADVIIDVEVGNENR